MQRQRLDTISFNGGFNTSRSLLDRTLDGTSGKGSANSLLLGEGYSVPFGGLTSKGSNTGSRIMLQIGNSWGGIKDNGATLGSGSLFEDVGRSLWGIGSGAASKAGATIPGFLLSSILQVSLSVSGSYSGATTYQAGMPQPSAPDVGIPASVGAGFVGNVSGTVSAKIVRLRLTTGGVSRPSTTSAVISPSKRTIRLTFPSASSGQTHWAVFLTQQGFGGVGLHYRAQRNGVLDIPESVVAAGVVDGLSRTLEFDYQDGDLTEDAAEISYNDNYPPPAGTHAVRLENVMNVLGCYADAADAPSSTNPGTCIAVSLPNFYESYKPRHVLFMPEQVVSVLSRASDSYAWIGCRNSILTLQYIGLSDAPACTIATAFPNVGVAYHHNWAQFYNRICLFTAKGALVMLTENGDLDETFAAPIKKHIKDWLPENTVVGFDASINSLVVANGVEIFVYCLDNGKWSDPCYLPDSGIAGTVLACTPTGGRLVVTTNNAGAQTAHDFNSGGSAIPISKVSNWRGRASVNIYELEAAVSTSQLDFPVAVVLQQNLRPMVYRNVTAYAGNNLLIPLYDSGVTVNMFDPQITGDRVFVYGTNIGGTNVHYLVGKLLYDNAYQARLVDDAGNPVNTFVNNANVFMLFGKFLKVFHTPRAGAQHVANLFPVVRDARSYAVGLWQMTDAKSGEFIELNVIGTGGETSLSKA